MNRADLTNIDADGGMSVDAFVYEAIVQGDEQRLVHWPPAFDPPNDATYEARALRGIPPIGGILRK